MPEIIISAVLGALAAAVTYFVRGIGKYRWWISWVPAAAKHRKIVIGVAALVGGGVAALGEMIVSIVVDQAQASIGAGVVIAVVTAFIISQAKGAVALPFEPLNKLISEFEKDLGDQVLEVIHEHINNAARTVDKLDGLVELCRNIHELAKQGQKYNDDNQNCDVWGRLLDEWDECRQGSDEKFKHQTLGPAANQAIQMVLKFQIKRGMVDRYL